jgi:DNA-binding CsgD family transcriptional regulator
MQAWLDGIRRAADEAFEGQIEAQAYAIRIEDGEGIALTGYAIGDSFTDTFLDCMKYADDAAIACYRAGPIMQATRIVPPGHPSWEAGRRGGLTDVFTAVGFASPTLGCAISFPIGTPPAALPRPVRSGLARLAAHLGAAYRLRIRSRGDGEAVLTPNGAVLHACGDAEPRGARERLREAAKKIAYAKRESKHDPVAGLTFWTAMVEGRWTLVERTDSDGKRLVIAHRNEPHTVEHRALSKRERIVLERASLGSPLRYVAYELGLAESTVSETLARAIRKLGIRSRAELIELYASIVGP